MLRVLSLCLSLGILGFGVEGLETRSQFRLRGPLLPSRPGLPEQRFLGGASFRVPQVLSEALGRETIMRRLGWSSRFRSLERRF